MEQLTEQLSQLESKAKELEESVSYQKIQTEKVEVQLTQVKEKYQLLKEKVDGLLK